MLLKEDFLKIINNKGNRRLVFNVATDAGFYSEFNNMLFCLVYCLEKNNRISFYTYLIDFVQNEWHIYYTGTLQTEQVEQIIKQRIEFPDMMHLGYLPGNNSINTPKTATVFVYNKPALLQSKISFYTNCSAIKPDVAAACDGFNLYVGGDLSGLAIQEIREYRSMAYEVSAETHFPSINGEPVLFTGYMATQADKTIAALGAYVELLQNMPSKPERINMIRDYLINAAVITRP